MKMSPKHIKAKMAALDALLKESGDMEADEYDNEFKNLKKVTVAADSDENLEEGLDKAKELLEGQEEETELSLPSKEKSEDDMIEEEELPKMKSEIKRKKPKLNFFE